VVVIVFDISNLHVKGREWNVGKGRSRSLVRKEGERKWREKGRRKGGEQPVLTIKIRFRASKHQFGRPVKSYISQALNGIRHKADAVKLQIPKPISKLLVGGQGIHKAFAFKTKVTFHNMPRSKACKRLFCNVVK